MRWRDLDSCSRFLSDLTKRLLTHVIQVKQHYNVVKIRNSKFPSTDLTPFWMGCTFNLLHLISMFWLFYLAVIALSSYVHANKLLLLLLRLLLLLHTPLPSTLLLFLATRILHRATGLSDSDRMGTINSSPVSEWASDWVGERHVDKCHWPDWAAFWIRPQPDYRCSRQDDRLASKSRRQRCLRPVVRLTQSYRVVSQTQDDRHSCSGVSPARPSAISKPCETPSAGARSDRSR